VKHPAEDDSLWNSVYRQKKTIESAWEKAYVGTDATSLRPAAWSDAANSAQMRLTLSAPWIDECLAEQTTAQ
jgi:hypothetical protein